MSNYFYIIFPCKPYVKQFIIHNFGEPADFGTHKTLFDDFIRAIKKPNTRFDYRDDYVLSVKNYKSKIDLVISEDLFYRHGWMLSVTDIIALNRKLESLVKCFMQQMVGVSVANGMPIKNSIEDFQERFDYPEEVWAYESIKKDFQRNGQRIARSYQNEIIKINQRLFMEQLSRTGTIVQKAIKHYENIQQSV